MKGKTAPKPDNARERILNEYYAALLKEGVADYYMADTFQDTSDPGRAVALKAVDEMFNFIFQRNRVDAAGRVPRIGQMAHMWEGEVREKLGDARTALDIYDEALANAPDPGDRISADKDLDPLYAQVQCSRLGIVAKEDARQFLEEARPWLEAYPQWRAYDGYQGVALLVAKLYLAEAEKRSGEAKTRLLKQARTILDLMAKVHSSYQQEAVALLRDMGVKRGEPGRRENVRRGGDRKRFVGNGQEVDASRRGLPARVGNGGKTQGEGQACRGASRQSPRHDRSRAV